MTTGIYCIENIVDNKKYIGKSETDINKRLNRHKRELRKNSHINNHLQNAWNKYTEENFSFYILEEIENDSLLINKKESFWIEFFETKSEKNGYNQTYGGEGCLGYHHSVEIKCLLSDINKGNKNFLGKHHSEETKNKLRNKTPWNKGKTLPNSTKEKISKSLIGNTRRNGKIMSEETKKKISESMKIIRNKERGGKL